MAKEDPIGKLPSSIIITLILLNLFQAGPLTEECPGGMKNQLDPNQIEAKEAITKYESITS